MKVEIAISKNSGKTKGGYQPCGLKIGTQTFCIVNWWGEPYGKLSSEGNETFSKDEFDVVDLLEILKVKK